MAGRSRLRRAGRFLSETMIGEKPVAMLTGESEIPRPSVRGLSNLLIGERLTNFIKEKDAEKLTGDPEKDQNILDQLYARLDAAETKIRILESYHNDRNLDKLEEERERSRRKPFLFPTEKKEKEDPSAGGGILSGLLESVLGAAGLTAMATAGMTALRSAGSIARFVAMRNPWILGAAVAAGMAKWAFENARSYADEVQDRINETMDDNIKSAIEEFNTDPNAENAENAIAEALKRIREFNRETLVEGGNVDPAELQAVKDAISGLEKNLNVLTADQRVQFEALKQQFNIKTSGKPDKDTATENYKGLLELEFQRRKKVQPNLSDEEILKSLRGFAPPTTLKKEEALNVRTKFIEESSEAPRKEAEVNISTTTPKSAPFPSSEDAGFNNISMSFNPRSGIITIQPQSPNKPPIEIYPQAPAQYDEMIERSRPATPVIPSGRGYAKFKRENAPERLVTFTITGYSSFTLLNQTQESGQFIIVAVPDSKVNTRSLYLKMQEQKIILESILNAVDKMPKVDKTTSKPVAMIPPTTDGLGSGVVTDNVSDMRFSSEAMGPAGVLASKLPIVPQDDFIPGTLFELAAEIPEKYHPGCAPGLVPIWLDGDPVCLLAKTPPNSDAIDNAVDTMLTQGGVKSILDKPLSEITEDELQKLSDFKKPLDEEMSQIEDNYGSLTTDSDLEKLYGDPRYNVLRKIIYPINKILNSARRIEFKFNEQSSLSVLTPNTFAENINQPPDEKQPVIIAQSPTISPSTASNGEMPNISPSSGSIRTADQIGYPLT